MLSVRFSASVPPVRRSGFTLLELGIVVLLLALLATLAATKLSGVSEEARRHAAEAELQSLRSAILGNDAQPGLVADLDGIPGFSPAYLRLANLLVPTNLVGTADRWLDDDERRNTRAKFASHLGAVNPEAVYADFVLFTNRDDIAQRGWHGPYLRTYRPLENTDAARVGEFPRKTDRRHVSDDTFEERGFFSSDGLPPNGMPYGVPGEPAIGDPWGNPYVLQVPPAEAFEHPDLVSESERFRFARLVSAGRDGILSTPYRSRLAGRTAHGTDARGDDLVLFLLRPDVYEK